jgi:hypothetical protein
MTLRANEWVTTSKENAEDPGVPHGADLMNFIHWFAENEVASAISNRGEMAVPEGDQRDFQLFRQSEELIRQEIRPLNLNDFYNR